MKDTWDEIKMNMKSINKKIKFETTRNHGIDALRLYSMFLVVILHVLGQGGVIAFSNTPEKYAVSWFLEISAYCAVNIFALISGYVSYSDKEKPYRYSRYVSSWLQVFVYSFGFTLLYHILQPDLTGMNKVIYAMAPVMNSSYWYFNAYTGLFFVIPWLNRLVRSSGRRELNGLMLTLFLVFSCYGTFAKMNADVFVLKSGYSFLWLSIIYLGGAWMKKHQIVERYNKKQAIVLILFLTMLIC